MLKSLNSPSSVRLLDVSAALVGVLILFQLYYYVTRTPKTTRLRGPKSPSILFGFGRGLFGQDSAPLFETLSKEYGGVFELPGPLGSKRVILADPKAIAHFYALETFTYQQTRFAQTFLAGIFGRGILFSEGESHRRQRKILTPAFSSQAIKELMPIFYDSVYKATSSWDAILEANSTGEAVIDVQNWMNRISLDTIGIAGFSHDFRTLAGARSIVAEAFEALGSGPRTALQGIVLLLSTSFPLLYHLPGQRLTQFDVLDKNMTEIAHELLSETKTADEAEEKSKKKSIIGALVKAEKNDSQLYLTPVEVIAQMKTLLVAGYETTSISLTWALIELSLHPGLQDKLREELRQLNGDATYEQLTGNALPYLDGVVRETLRLHPPLPDTNRVAVGDDVLPLSEPITLPSGKQTDRVTIGAGTAMYVPIKTMNTAPEFWGADARDFVPERWIGEQGLVQQRALEIQGWGHILTFIDGPRTCLGRGFAIAEFKAVLSTLIRNYSFLPRDGPTMVLERGRTLLPRPKLAGEEGCKLPLRVRRLDQ